MRLYGVRAARLRGACYRATPIEQVVGRVRHPVYVLDTFIGGSASS
jgi:hypothetical protein